MKKQVLAATMAMVLAASAMTGCGGNGASGTTAATTAAATTAAATAAATTAAATTAAAQGEETTQAAEADNNMPNGLPVDYFAGTTLNIYTQNGSADLSTDPSEKLIVQLAEEATGIHINWTVLSSQAWTERVNLMLASGDMPDAFLQNISQNTIGTNIDRFYELSDGSLETYAPATLATIQTAYPNGIEALRWPDGSIRSLPTSSVASSSYDWVNWLIMINKTWLDRVNMDMPTTTDELYEVLCAFRDRDANGNGDPSDEIPFGFADKDSNINIGHTANYFGIANAKDGTNGRFKMVKNGVVTPTADTDEWRAWLEWLNKLYDAGLLDPEGFSQTKDEYTTKLSSDLYGVAMMFSPVHQGLNPDEWELLWVKGLDGVEPVHDGTSQYDATKKFGFTISATCSNVPALLHWWDYMSSTRELKLISRMGEMGLVWNEKDGQYYSSEDYIDSQVMKDHPDWTRSNLQQTLGFNDRCVLVSYDDLVPDGPDGSVLYKGEFKPADPYQSATCRTILMNTVSGWLQDEYMPSCIEDPDAVADRTLIETDLFPMITNFASTSIVNGVTDESWNTYKQSLETYGYYDWIEWYNENTMKN